MLTQDGQVEAAITVHGPRRRRSERTRSAVPSMATVKTGRGNLAPLDERLSTAAHREKKRRSMHSDGSATSTGCWRASSGGAAAMMTNW
ncbi:alpha-1,2-mannosyltransferase [Metarhizium robertsii ARSEF 23]|uniref:Alpha-1,2-mannosyltransferase n=1 Tax=Metarhizium robertsii (strain ARSEF 23 / ATCC MYA-3075) TaxID=655844 RepID=A0A0B2XFN1_METRA|nr:alpha-1,2-mannosyltransferase [Metarhizium robertsii ARSEF 23]KHO10834.1 alpha-1,2-mannosyltransferase [Metarhizium robertsii ARSEF 23]